MTIAKADWDRLEPILNVALDLPKNERAEYLEKACEGDSELKDAVANLLAADEKTVGVLEESLGDFGAPVLEEMLSDDNGGGDDSGSGEYAGHQIGPYRILREIGHGGMGEVYQAYDARLDRTVAMKRILLNTGKGRKPRAGLRERFRREAKAAAGLTHPSIVQIHDILVDHGEEKEDWLVMEFVEGQSLAALVEDGPLPEPRALALGAEIASGLAAAHTRGIIHRDLKTENVLVTTDGHAKILDFGLAKRLDTEGAATDPTLTATQSVIGTSRSMSPEQAKGEVVDTRTDLFSLGTLLYEIVTGESPFRNDNAAVTLTRVCTHTQTAAQAINPSVSADLSGLIDRLLRKNPLDRPGTADEVATAMSSLSAGSTYEGLQGRSDVGSSPMSRFARPILLLTGGLAVMLVGVLQWRRLDPPVPLYVAVMEPELSGRDSTEDSPVVDNADLLVGGVSAAVQRTLADLEGIAAVTDNSLDIDSRDPSLIARALAAQEVLQSRIDCQRIRCQVTLSRLAANDSRVLWVTRFDVATDDMGLLATATSTHLRKGYPEHPSRTGQVQLSLDSDAYKSFLELNHLFRTGVVSSDSTYLDELAELRTRTPGFLEPLLLEASVLRRTFEVSRDASHLSRALEVLEMARAVAPHDPRVLFERFDIARKAGRLEEADQFLRELQSAQPGHPGVIEREAFLEEERGKPEEALALMRRATSLNPSFKSLFNLAMMEYRQGHPERSLETVRGLLDRVPTSVAARSILAQLEMLNGQLDEAARLYRELFEENAGVVEVANLGVTHMLLGRYDLAIDACQTALELQPTNPGFALNLADSQHLAGRLSPAESNYRLALSLLSTNQTEPKWQDLTVGAQAYAHLGQREAAVASLQRALELAPSNPQVSYEASLVYSLLGYAELAMVHGEKALKGGFGARWFQLPWFERLLISDGKFRELLAQAPY